MLTENQVSSSGNASPYLLWLRNCQEDDDDESENGHSGGILDGLKSWLGFAGAVLGSDSSLIRKSMRKKSLLGKSSG